ncbi:MAG: VOC family protein [Anaerolineae bacterium]
MSSFVRGIAQVCVMSSDIEATARGFNQLGIGPFKVWHYQPPMVSNTQLRKKPQHFTMKLGLAWVGAMEVEIIQPMEGESIYREYLAQHGTGLHHMSLGYDSFPRAVKRMERQQIPVLQSGMLNAPLLVGGMTLPPLPDFIAKPFGPRFAFFDSEKILGTVVEFAAVPPGMPYRMAVKIGKPSFYVPADASDIGTPLANRFISAINKVGIVTPDAEALAYRYQQVLDIGGWKYETLEWSENVLRGQAAPCRLRRATTVVNGTTLELVQPLEGASLYQEWLAQHGEGIHYLGVRTDGLSFEQALARFAAEGCDVLMAGRDAAGQRFAYVNSKPLTGAPIELVSV